jgi:hypothetical protein
MGLDPACIDGSRKSALRGRNGSLARIVVFRVAAIHSAAYRPCEGLLVALHVAQGNGTCSTAGSEHSNMNKISGVRFYVLAKVRP